MAQKNPTCDENDENDDWRFKEPKTEWVVLDSAKDGVAIAKEMVANSMENRKPAPKHVNTLVRLLLSNMWISEMTADIIVTTSKKVKNGTHRLVAFIQAAELAAAMGRTIKIAFRLRYVEREDRVSAIQGNTRSPDSKDMVTIITGDRLYTTLIPIAPVIKLILFRGRASSAFATLLVEEYHDKLLEFKPFFEEACEMLGPKKIVGLANAPVIAAITRAILARQSKKDIRRFCGLLNGTVFPSGSDLRDKFAMAMRDDLLAHPKNVGAAVTQAYQRMEYSLHAFLRNSPFVESKRPIRASIELFPYPGESLPPDRNEKPTAFLAPLIRPGVPREKQLEALYAGTYAFPGNFKKIPKGSTVVFFFPKDRDSSKIDGSVVGRGNVRQPLCRVGEDVPGMSLYDVRTLSSNLVEKLLSLSVSRGGVLNLDKILSKITPITASDVEELSK